MDAIIGSIVGYKPEDIAPFVETLDMVGFSGEKIMIMYNVSDRDKSTIEYLNSHDWEVVEIPLKLPIMTQRFTDYYELLIKRPDIHRVIIADVKDVIFQQDPFQKMSDGQLTIGQESIKCKDMEWSAENYKMTFPQEYRHIQDNVSVCAGVIGGDRTTVSIFCQTVFRFATSSLGLYKPSQTPDQAAVNVIIGLGMTNVKQLTHSDAWVTHLGVSMEPKHGEFLTDTIPTVDDGVVVNESGEPFSIVHQYDRFEIKNEILAKLP